MVSIFINEAVQEKKIALKGVTVNQILFFYGKQLQSLGIRAAEKDQTKNFPFREDSQKILSTPPRQSSKVQELKILRKYQPPHHELLWKKNIQLWGATYKL